MNKSGFKLSKSELEVSGSGQKSAENEWEWPEKSENRWEWDANEWEQVGMNGKAWEQMGVGWIGWEHSLVLPVLFLLCL